MRRLCQIIALLWLALASASCVGELPEDPARESSGNRIILRLDNRKLVSRAADAPSGESTAPLSAAQITEETENRINHIDVLIFNADNGSKVHHERVLSPLAQDRSGVICLEKNRDFFAANQKYCIYLIANSTADVSVFANEILTRNDLLKMKQTDERVHATGIVPQSQGLDPSVIPPAVFLMDGVAYNPKTNSEPIIGSVPTVVLNSGDSTEDIELKAALRHAVAKIRIVIDEGDNVTFAYNANAGYNVHNLPYSTLVVADAEEKNDEGEIIATQCPDLREPSGLVRGPFFEWGQEKNSDGTTVQDHQEITVTAYAYSHSWTTGSLSENRTSVIVSIPLYYGEPVWQKDESGNDKVDENGDKIPQRFPNGTIIREENHAYKNGENGGEPQPLYNYYRIPISKNGSLVRNTFYQVKVRINSVGSTMHDAPLEIQPIEYKDMEWKEEILEVGNAQTKPKYLRLSANSATIHNADSTLIEFTSSSPITKVEVAEAFFYDKEGIRRDLNKQYDGSYVDKETFDKIVAVYDPKAYNGQMEIRSPRPTNNAVRFIKLEITNEDNVVQEITVKQYPLEYITHVVGKYSYRKDFVYGDGVTSYEMVNGKAAENGSYVLNPVWWSNWGDRLDRGEGRYVIANWDTNNGDWVYSDLNNPSVFFGSKVAIKKNDTYELNYYDWEENKQYNRYNYSRTTRYYSVAREEINGNIKYEGNLTGLNNPRMYYIRITTTSKNYVLGQPAKIIKTINNKDYSITDPSDANAKLVSPSFMLASQLGSTAGNTVSSIDMAATHCANYVEVAEDGTEYDDWRLPTRAEINIIYEFQNKFLTDKYAAMSTVMGGAYFWCASSVIYENPVNNKGLLDRYLVHNEGKTELSHYIRCVRDAY